MSLRIYTVHSRVRPSGVERDPILIREGFSWFAFLVPELFALWHREWLGLLVYLAVAGGLALVMAAAALTAAAQALIHFGLHLLVGLTANDWRRWRAGKAGLREVAAVVGHDRDEALHRFLDRYLLARNVAQAAAGAREQA